MATVATAPRTTPYLRLTRRGRLAMTLLALAVALIGVVAGASSAFGRTVPAAPSFVVVEPGDTLWSLARAANPSEDPRTTIELLRELNGLGPDSPLVPGQQLVLPAA